MILAGSKIKRMYVVFFFLQTRTGPNCDTLNADLDCNTCLEYSLGTGTVTPINEGDQCQDSGTCITGTCTGGK